MTNKHAQRTAMGRQFLDVKSTQAVFPQHELDRAQRKVGKMLVVDRVELRALDHAQQMRKFQRRHASRFSSTRKPATKSRISGTCASTLLAAIKSAP